MANEFWENNTEAIKRAALGVKRGKSRVLAKSQGGRDIYLIEYGEKQDFKRTANYNSASYHRDLGAYADKNGAKPVVLIAGATHGGEIEGIAAILNLINELETGKDLRGCSHKFTADLPDDYRLLIIPCLNPDGRDRIPMEITPEDPDEATYYKHGQFLDGAPADYGVAMRVHPALGKLAHMGGYYNDAGINLYADNYFAPMSVENAALFKLVDEEAPDVTLLLHTGCHKHGKLLQPYYTPGFVNKCVNEFDGRLLRSFEESGYTYYSLREHGEYLENGPISIDDEDIFPPPRLPMETAVHFICGGLSVVYESHVGRASPDDTFSLDNMLNCHFLLFEQAFIYANEYQKKFLTTGKKPKNML